MNSFCRYPSDVSGITTNCTVGGIGQIAKYSTCFMPKSALDSIFLKQEPDRKNPGGFVLRYSQVIHHDTPSVSVADKSSLEKYWDVTISVFLQTAPGI